VGSRQRGSIYEETIFDSGLILFCMILVGRWGGKYGVWVLEFGTMVEYTVSGNTDLIINIALFEVALEMPSPSDAMRYPLIQSFG
jgi:hypothetical protein